MKNYKNQQINRYIGYVFLVIYIIMAVALMIQVADLGMFPLLYLAIIVVIFMILGVLFFLMHRQYFIASHDFPLRGGRVLHPADDGCLGGRDDHGRTDGRGFRLCHE